MDILDLRYGTKKRLRLPLGKTCRIGQLIIRSHQCKQTSNIHGLTNISAFLEIWTIKQDLEPYKPDLQDFRNYRLKYSSWLSQDQGWSSGQYYVNVVDCIRPISDPKVTEREISR